MRALALAAFAMLAASTAGCSEDSVIVREVNGTVVSPAGHTIGEVMMTDPTSGQSASGNVDEAGNFSVKVYGYDRGVVRVLFKENGVVIGVVSFSDGHEGVSTVFPITDAPEPGASPKNGPSGGDSESRVNYVYANVGIELGQITDAGGKGIFLPATNPLSQVDTDGDGAPDLSDADDDGDGTKDVGDTDANGNNVEDFYESDDQNADGVPDEIQAGPESP